MYIEWSRSSKAGLNFRAAYEFIKDTYCGYHTTTKPEGEVNGGDLASSGLKLNQYYQQRCTWILDSLTDRQLTIEVKSGQSRKESFIFTNTNKKSFGIFIPKKLISDIINVTDDWSCIGIALIILIKQTNIFAKD